MQNDRYAVWAVGVVEAEHLAFNQPLNPSLTKTAL